MPKRVRAVLGPTNTGKTHYALERMLAHASGIIGFPLRLLARENYDRMVAIKGRNSVALITGEEKIVPPGARWFSCTVEAMPLDRAAEFIAVDEIQLCADPDRGHIFTDRLLHARGLVETLFLGAETIRPLLTKLVPQVEIDTRPRLSGLIDAGPIKLSKLPARSAIVAFSAAEVYAIAEVVRRRRGGCAVIMGQLSPRTRNAQVELYQNKEVDYLVATDAIGMGLNMDVTHVALAGLSKFDGTSPRALLPQEVAQIAGRAGRGMKDGTFGTTADCPPMSPTLIEAIETHRFDPINRLYWRNSTLDFTSPKALLNSLLAPPPRPGLTSGRVASDLATLDTLAYDPDILKVATTRSRTKLLWEVCQIPDFRKLGDDTHTRLCARLFFLIQEYGAIPANWLENHIANFARTDGDIDTLMHRLSGVRVCSYVAARTDWSRNASAWQDRAREVEDMLSDALHERLTARFVDRRATTLLRRLDDETDRKLLSAITAEGDIIVEGHPIGRMHGFALKPDESLTGPDQKLVLRAGRQALLQEMPRRVQAMLDAPENAFSIDWATRSVAWNTIPIGRITPGQTLINPSITPLPGEFQDATQRDRVTTHLKHILHTQITQTLAPLFTAHSRAARNPQLRGILHRLCERAGIMAATPADHALPRATRHELRRLGIIVGRFTIFCPALLKPTPAQLCAALLSLHAKRDFIPPLPTDRVSIRREKADPEAARFGWIIAGPIWLRLDIAERLIHDCATLTRQSAKPAPSTLASHLGVSRTEIPAILRGLEIHHRPPEIPHALYGPPAPLLLLRTRQKPVPYRKSTEPPKATPHTNTPFSILSTFRARMPS